MTHTRSAVVAAVVLMAAVGCGEAPPPTGGLTGTVTYEGKPVTSGMILFSPADGNYRGSKTVKIVDGKYDATGVLVGASRVTIEGTTGPAPEPDADGNLKEDKSKAKGESISSNPEGLPEQIEVVPGAQTLDFKLTKPSGKKGK